MGKIITQWKGSKNMLKWLLVGVIAILVVIELLRNFIHNFTSKNGFWMFNTGLIVGIIGTLVVLSLVGEFNVITEVIDLIKNMVGGFN